MTALSKAGASQKAAQALIRVRGYLHDRGELEAGSHVEFARWLEAEERLGADAPDESTLNRWESGSRRMPGWFLIFLCEELNLSLRQLLGSEPLVPLPPGTLDRLGILEQAVERLIPQVQELVRRRQRRGQSGGNPAEAVAGS